MTDDELDRLDALAQAATPGPWNADDDGTIILAPDDVLSCCNMDELTVKFVAESRTAIPALIAEIRRLRAQIDGFQGLVNEARRWSDRPGMRWK
jgi:hypothetical protein